MSTKPTRYTLPAWVRAFAAPRAAAAPAAPAPAAATALPAAPPAAHAPPGRRWHALPGNVIELSDTGFSIALDTRPQTPLYTLRAPEGWICSWGSDLPGLKQLGERLAAERDEFVCRGPGWQP